jgi:hypothetical protein
MGKKKEKITQRRGKKQGTDLEVCPFEENR